MGLKSSKKPAMVLILILMIITSLSIFIIGAMKILTSSDEEFSINRNASGGTQVGMLGKFICYKKSDGKVYQQRVEYNSDGSIKFYIKETTNDNGKYCEFEIPKGVRNFEVLVVGGGGEGASTSREYKFTSKNPNCISENIDAILKQKKAILHCFNSYTNKTCSGTYDFSKNKISQMSTYIRNITGYEAESCTRECEKYSIGGKCKKWNNFCSKVVECGSGGAIQDPKFPPQSNCTLTFLRPSWQENIINKVIYRKNASEVTSIISVILGSSVSCEQRNPYYVVKVGMPGNPGAVKTTLINSVMYGSSKGENKIIINKDQIGDGGKSPTGKGGKTTFKYWYKNSKKYIEQTISAEGGSKGSYNRITISSPEQAETIESKEGEIPSSFSIPSIFDFREEQLHTGYYDTSKTAHHATYFGASGASGYIDIESSKLNSNTCSKKIISGVLDQAGCSDSNTSVYPNPVAGTNGAGGAILISW